MCVKSFQSFGAFQQLTVLPVMSFLIYKEKYVFHLTETQLYKYVFEVLTIYTSGVDGAELPQADEGARIEQCGVSCRTLACDYMKGEPLYPPLHIEVPRITSSSSFVIVCPQPESRRCRLGSATSHRGVVGALQPCPDLNRATTTARGAASGLGNGDCPAASPSPDIPFTPGKTAELYPAAPCTSNQSAAGAAAIHPDLEWHVPLSFVGMLVRQRLKLRCIIMVIDDQHAGIKGKSQMINCIVVPVLHYRLSDGEAKSTSAVNAAEFRQPEIKLCSFSVTRQARLKAHQRKAHRTEMHIHTVTFQEAFHTEKTRYKALCLCQLRILHPKKGNTSEKAIGLHAVCRYAQNEDKTNTKEAVTPRVPPVP
ncbi:hypothetical protein PAMA_002620 [Pampus argenteus]